MDLGQTLSKNSLTFGQMNMKHVVTSWSIGAWRYGVPNLTHYTAPTWPLNAGTQIQGPLILYKNPNRRALVNGSKCGFFPCTQMNI